MDTFLSYKKNDMLSKLNDKDKLELLIKLRNFYIDNKESLNLDSTKDITYGIELETYKPNLHNILEEFNKNNINYVDVKVTDIFSNTYKNKSEDIINNWIIETDTSILGAGKEFVSPILKPTKYDLEELKKVSSILKSNAYTHESCSLHMHIGSQILNGNIDNFIQFFKLYKAYENIIYRFCNGEHNSYRPRVINYAASSYDYLSLIIDKVDILNIKDKELFLKALHSSTNSRNYGLNLSNVKTIEIYDLFNTIEFRNANITLDYPIIENILYFYLRLLEYSKSNNYDMDIISKRDKMDKEILGKLEEYDIPDINKALEFSDMLYSNNYDKLCFLKQYIKDESYSYEYDKVCKLVK